MQQFEINKTYKQCFIGDSELIAYFLITRRTAKTVWIQRTDAQGNARGEVERKGLSNYENVEQFKPDGTYSMCMVVGADKPHHVEPA